MIPNSIAPVASTSTQSRKQWGVAILVLAAIVIALWLPYGLNIAGYGDEWVNIAATDYNARWFTNLFQIRSFLSVPYMIAHILTPDSFTGMNIILVIMTFGRGLAIYTLLRRLLPENPALALVAGGLASVYPGDVGFYALVCISITTALVFFILALVALVDYWKRPKWQVILLMWAALTFSVGIYEVSFPLIIVAPLILVYLQSRFSRRVIRVALLWYAIPLMYVVVVIIMQTTNPSTTSYQLRMVNADNSIVSVLDGFLKVYIRQFWQVWDWSVLNMPQGFSDSRTWIVIAVTTLFGVAVWVHMKPVTDTVSRRRYIIMLLAGVAVLGIGYSAFSITVGRVGYFRTLFYGLPGAAIAVAVLGWLLIRLQRIPRTVLAVVFLAIAVRFLLGTNRLSALLCLLIAVGFIVKAEWRYVIVGTGIVGIATASSLGFHALQPFANLPALQQQLATTIVTQAPAIKANSLILLTGAPGTKQQYDTFRGRYDIFQSMMQFIYKQYDIEAQLCSSDGIALEGDYPAICKFEADAVLITFATEQHRWSYDRVIAFTYEADKGAVLLKTIPTEWMAEQGAATYNPDALIDANAQIPYRLKTVWPVHQ